MPGHGPYLPYLSLCDISFRLFKLTSLQGPIFAYQFGKSTEADYVHLLGDVLYLHDCGLLSFHCRLEELFK